MPTYSHAFASNSCSNAIALAGIGLSTLLLFGCATSAISPQSQELQVPQQWHQGELADTQNSVSQTWLAALHSPALTALVPEAQAHNYQLARQRAQVEELRQTVTSTGALRWPNLSVDLGATRNRLENVSGTRDSNESWQTGLNIAWELDVWGKLSDSQRQAELLYQASLATLEQQRLQLAADVATSWFNTVANHRLQTLLAQRLQNVSSDLNALEQGYRLGINAALDVYLSRTTVADSRASLAQQQQNLQAATAQLQLLLARYPSGADLETDAALPEIETFTAAGTPTQMLQRRPDIQKAWLDLLAADAGLAVAHKNRFPAFSLAGSAGYAADGLRNLVDAGLSSWSIGASLVQPLFNAGRLKSLESAARARVVQTEQTYLDTVFNALAESETLLSAETTLRQQLAAQRESLANAELAYDLSLQQYERGLINYTTVLEAQRRAFDAQTAVIQVHSQMIRNRISLYRALGGDFVTADAGKP